MPPARAKSPCAHGNETSGGPIEFLDRAPKARAFLAAVLLAPLLFLLLTSAADAAEVDLPSPPGLQLAPGAPMAPVSAIGGPSSATPAAAEPRLALGSRGQQVRDLQRELRRRGTRVSVDGAYGPGTARAVSALQRRFRMIPTGVADAAFLRRMGLRLRGVASVAAAACTSTVLGIVDPPPPAVVGSTPPPILSPLRGTVSSPFGPRGGRMHEGIDIPCDTGFPVAAAAGGRVVAAGYDGAYGNLVVIERDGGMSTAYGHLSQIAVSVDQLVGAGQQIGLVGSTGRSSGAHLHFEIRLSSGPVDPLPYLDGLLPPPAVADVPPQDPEQPLARAADAGG